jgi:hypothetical protein
VQQAQHRISIAQNGIEAVSRLRQRRRQCLENEASRVLQRIEESSESVFEISLIVGPDIGRDAPAPGSHLRCLRTDLPELLEIGNSLILGVFRAKGGVAACAADIAALAFLRLRKELGAQRIGLVDQSGRHCVLTQDNKAVALQAMHERSGKCLASVRVSTAVIG